VWRPLAHPSPEFFPPRWVAAPPVYPMPSMGVGKTEERLPAAYLPALPPAPSVAGSQGAWAPLSQHLCAVTGPPCGETIAS